MKGTELMPQLGAALAKNTVCQELILTENNISDSMMADLATALETNTTLVHLKLEGNKVGNDGATLLAKALAKNRSLLLLDLFAQKGGKPLGDATLHAFCDMFESNVTLLKIKWRLESRQSFRLNKLLVRNNDINRRIKDGKDYGELLPAGVAPLSAELIAQREAASHIVGGSASPRDSSASARFSSFSDAGGPPMSFGRPSSVSSSGSSAERFSLKPASPTLAEGESLEDALKALDAEYEKKAAELKAAFDARRQALIAKHKPSSPAAEIS